ncbi:fumarylacetoacetate hydrolase family protein [Aestuariimicrobium ganziense]|uniref:fumarylacetoacetate hydrolase family protein n=1 Tax=Aestuariimicrobium ganziense TaxID=2773677 RepID=UPI001942E312|nr:fumarylacetoacetate hydrolase family protein [Aestuariimicrobium ganziense]
MKLLHIGDRGAERPVIEVDGVHRDASSLVDRFTGEAFGDLDRLREAAADLPEIDISGQRIGSPVLRPQSVVCIGMNYAAHAAESGGTPPQRPIIFFKTPNTIAGPDDPVTIPQGSVKTDWEVELGIVIGRAAWRLASPDDAAAHIAGYVLANDLSERTWQIEESGGQWSKGKCAPGYNPVGPWVATPDEFDPSDVALRSWVNGEPRQDSRTADMIFDVPTIVHHLSQYLRLEPGDLVLTGTPEGVALSGRFPYLSPGDVVEVEIDGLGRQRQTYVSEGEQA